MNEYSRDKWSDEELLNYFGSLFANKEYYTERTNKVKAELLDRMKHAGEMVVRQVNVEELDEWAAREYAQRDAQLEAIRESEARVSRKVNRGTDVV